MKTCPNCNSEVDDNFELCWNCNYSFSENSMVEIRDEASGPRDLSCVRCSIPLLYAGDHKFHEGFWTGLLWVNREKFELYICPKCGKVEFFIPLKEMESSFADGQLPG